MTGTVHVLEIPGWIPWSDNDLIGCHWATKNRRKDSDKEMVRFYARQSAIPIATNKRRLSVTFFKPRRAGDPQNCLKSLLDACTGAGLIVDDSPPWLELGEIRLERGERRTVITLEDLADENA